MAATKNKKKIKLELASKYDFRKGVQVEEQRIQKWVKEGKDKILTTNSWGTASGNSMVLFDKFTDDEGEVIVECTIIRNGYEQIRYSVK